MLDNGVELNHCFPASGFETKSGNSSATLKSSVEELFSSLGYDSRYVNGLLDTFNKENVFKVNQLEFVVKKMVKNNRLKNYSCSRCGKVGDNEAVLSKVNNLDLVNKVRLYDDIVCVLYSFGDINIDISFLSRCLLIVVYVAIPFISIIYNFSFVRFVINSVVIVMGLPIIIMMNGLTRCTKHDSINASNDIMGTIISLMRNNLFNFNMSRPVFSNRFTNRIIAVMQDYVN